MKPVSVIIPCYNEEGVVRSVLEAVHHKLATVAGLTFEIIAVNDGSTDRTGEVLRAIQLPGLKVVEQPFNRGYGAALKRGIRDATHGLVMILDADGTYPIDTLPRLLAEAETADMAVGARTGKDVNIPLIRRPAKWCINRLANYLTGFKIPDLNSGLRVIRRDVVERFESILPDGFSFTTTITLAMLTNGYHVVFLPINYGKRHGHSKIRPIADTLNFIQLIVRTVSYFQPLKVFVPLSALLFLGFLVLFVLRLVHGAGFLATSVILLVSSIQVLTTGMLADLIQRRTKL